MPRMRRSSTGRSIGNRSDFESMEMNGDEDEIRSRRSSRAGSYFDPDRIREKVEADEHLHHYISEQLERVKAERSVDGYEDGDEIEAHAG